MSRYSVSVSRMQFRTVFVLQVLVTALLAAMFLFPQHLFSQLPTGEIRKRIDAAGTYPGAASVIIYEHTRVFVEQSGRSTERKTVLRKMLTQQGAVDNSVLRFSYDPLSSKIVIKGVRIFRADGSVDEVYEAGALDLPRPARRVFWGGRMKLLPLPHLCRGDAVEVCTEKTGFNVAYLSEQDADDERFIPPMEGTFNDVITFQETLPVEEKEYVLNMPRDMPIQYRLYNGKAASSITFHENRTMYAWTMKKIPPLKRESGMVSSSDVATKLVISTLENWHEKSRWFYEVSEPQLAPDEAIRKKVEELTEGIITDEEKMAVLTHWVAEEVRYIGLSMGKGEGYTVHNASVTFHDRGGVCKDKAALLVSMLRAAGMESYVVMTEAGARVEYIPADQFNHCVSCVRRADGSLRLLDPTWAPNSREVWSTAESLQHVVFGVPEGRDLARAPYFPPEENYMKIHSRTEISENGDLSAALTVRCDGAPDTLFRRLLEGTPVAQRKQVFHDALTRIAPNVHLADLSFSDPNDFSKPFAVTLRYEAPGYAIKTGSQLVFTPPLGRHLFSSGRMSDYLYRAAPEKRTHPFRIRATRLVEFIEEIVLPEGAIMKASPQEASLSGEAADFSYTVSEAENVIKTSERIVLKHRVNPAGTYENFRRVISAVNGLFEAKMVVSLRAQKVKL